VTAVPETVYPAADLALARRLERAEGTACAAYVDARRELQPDSSSLWIEIAGAYAMFDGIGSPLTQTFGLGVFEDFLDPQFDRVERFYRERGAPTDHEVCALAEPATQELLRLRGYQVIEESVVLVRPTAAPVSSPPAITVRFAERPETGLWSRVAGQGWSSESPELGTFMEDFGGVVARARGVRCFLAELDGRPVAAAALNLANGVALLAGASTIPDARRRGAQQALLAARLEFSAALGIDLAMVVTQPGSGSQRNSERQGFRPVYTRKKWRLPAA
jgi:GNAT superfamily N-acetyltransferase